MLILFAKFRSNAINFEYTTYTEKNIRLPTRFVATRREIGDSIVDSLKGGSFYSPVRNIPPLLSFFPAPTFLHIGRDAALFARPASRPADLAFPPTAPGETLTP